MNSRPASVPASGPLAPALAPGRALGVVIVSFRSQDVILDCLESLLATAGQPLRILIVDNASGDGTPARIRAWADGSDPAPDPVPADSVLPYDRVPHGPVPLEAVPEGGAGPRAGAVGLLELPENRGFAGGVNAGLAALAALPEVAAFWVLNPDAMSAPDTPARMMAAADARPDWGLLGGRIFYAGTGAGVGGPPAIQCDSGVIERRRGVCRMLNTGEGPDTPLPKRIDYVSGAHLMISRPMLAWTGGLVEDYFLYWEEIDLAARRGDLTLGLVPHAPVFHHSGTAIGSPAPGRGPGEMSAWFNARGALRFQWRHNPMHLPTTWTWLFARAGRAAARGHWPAVRGVLRAALGMGPPAEVRRRLSPVALGLATAAPEPGIPRGPISRERALTGTGRKAA